MIILRQEQERKCQEKKISTNQFWSSPSFVLLNALHFFALDWYRKMPLELRPIRGENKVISQIHYDFSIQAAEKVFFFHVSYSNVQKRSWNNVLEHFQQHFFSSSHLSRFIGNVNKRRETRELQTGQLKNPSEAFNLLLQQNFISTLFCLFLSFQTFFYFQVYRFFSFMDDGLFSLFLAWFGVRFSLIIMNTLRWVRLLYKFWVNPKEN